MKKRVISIAVAAGCMVMGLAQAAGVTLNAARVGAEDEVAAVKFYEAAFGLREVMRLPVRGHFEIMLNFGDSVAAAKANPGAQIVVMHRDSNELKDPVPHLIFNVVDIAATAAAVKAAGGTLDGDPRPFGNSAMVIGFAVDPAGNRIELIQLPKH